MKSDKDNLGFRTKKSNKMYVQCKYDTLKNVDIRLANSLLQKNQTEFQKVTKEIQKQLSSNAKTDLFKKLFNQIKQNDLDLYCMDTLLAAYHFNNFEYLKEVRQRIIYKEKLTPSDKVNKQNIIAQIQGKIKLNLEFQKFARVLQYLDKANYVDANKFLTQIQDIKMREIFLFFAFCKTEYRKQIVYGNSSVSTQNISLTNLNQITNKQIQKLDVNCLKQEMILFISSIFLMNNYRMTDFLLVVSKIKDLNCKNSLIQMNRIIFNMNILIKYIKSLKKSEKQVFQFPKFQKQVYEQINQISQLRDHFQSVNFCLDYLTKKVKGQKNQIQNQQMAQKQSKIFLFTKVKVQQLYKAIQKTMKNSLNIGKIKESQKHTEGLTKWYIQKFKCQPTNLSQNFIPILNKFYQKAKNNPQFLSYLDKQQEYANELEQIRVKYGKQREILQDANQIIKMIQEMYEKCCLLDKQSQQFRQQLNYKKKTNNNLTPQTNKSMQSNNLISSMTQKCLKVWMFINDLSDQGLNKVGKNKTATKNNSGHLLQQSIKKQLQIQREAHKKTKQNLQKALQAESNYNQLKADLYSQQFALQNKIKDMTSQHQVYSRLKEEAIKKMEVQINDLRKHSSLDLKKQFQKTEIQAKYIEHQNQLVQMSNKSIKELQKQLKQQSETHDKNIRVNNANFNKQKEQMQAQFQGSINKLKNELSSAKCKISIFQKQSKQYQPIIQQKNEKIAELQHNYNAVSLDIQQYIAATTKQTIQNSEITAKNEQLVNKLNDVQKKLAQKQKELQDTLNNFRGLVNQIDQKSFIKGEEERRYANLQQIYKLSLQRCQTLQQELNIQKDRGNSLTAQLSKNSSRIKQLQDLLINIKQQLGKNQKNADQIKQKDYKIEESKGKIQQLTKKIFQIQNKLNQKIRQSGKNVSIHYEKQQILNKHVSQLRQKLIQSEETISNLYQKIRNISETKKQVPAEQINQKIKLFQQIQPKNKQFQQLNKIKQADQVKLQEANQTIKRQKQYFEQLLSSLKLPQYSFKNQISLLFYQTFQKQLKQSYNNISLLQSQQSKAQMNPQDKFRQILNQNKKFIQSLQQIRLFLQQKQKQKNIQLNSFRIKKTINFQSEQQKTKTSQKQQPKPTKQKQKINNILQAKAFQNQENKVNLNQIAEHIVKIHPQKQNISAFMLVYKYKINQKDIFSKMTTNKKNLFVIARTKLNQVIGGFTSQGFGTQKYDNDGYGFLFSGDKQNKIRYFDLKTPQKVPSQCMRDEIKFGYRQLIIKKGNILQTDFATPRHPSQGHYSNSNQLTRQQFIYCQSKQYAPIQVLDYQIYQVTFDNQIILQSKDVQEMKLKLQKQLNETKRLNNELNTLKTEIQKYKVQLRELSTKIAQLQKQLQNENVNSLQAQTIMKQQKQSLSTNILELRSEIQKLQQNITAKEEELNLQKTKLQNQKTFAATQSKKKILQLDEANEQNKDLKEQINNLKKQLEGFKTQINWKDKCQNIEQEKSTQIQSHKRQIQNKNNQFQQQKAKFIERQSQRLKIKNQMIEQHAAQVKELKDKLFAQIQQLKLFINKQQQINKKLQDQISQSKTIAEQKSKQLNKLEKQVEKNRNYDIYFQGEIFDSEPYDSIIWFVDQLESHCERRIKKTRLLYKKDDNSNINFHVYFDGKPNIVLLIKLKSGIVLAGYSEPPFIKGQKRPGETGFIFSFHNQKVFGLKREGIEDMDPKPRPITYDQYYMIFGNSQIRLRFRQDMLFSNFGILGGYYNNCKQTVDCLIGQQKERESQIWTYQIFQVTFK